MPTCLGLPWKGKSTCVRDGKSKKIDLVRGKQSYFAKNSKNDFEWK